MPTTDIAHGSVKHILIVPGALLKVGMIVVFAEPHGLSRDGQVVKGVQFVDIRDAGDPVEVARRYNEEGADEIDGAVFDVGVSSHQLDVGERGFSYRRRGPLDMRMSQAGETAADFVNKADEAKIARVIKTYGEDASALGRFEAWTVATKVAMSRPAGAGIEPGAGHAGA